MLNLRAFGTLAVLLVSSVAMQVVVGIPCMLFIYPINRWNRRLYGYASRTIGTWCQAYWVEMVAFLFPKTTLVVTGHIPADNSPKIVLVNHQVDVDWWYAWALSLCTRPLDAGRVKIMLKDSLKYVPIFGWGCWFFGFIFIKRNWNQDAARLARTMNECVQDGLPLWILMFPEGTTVHKEALDKGNAFARETSRPQFKHVLLPREKGFSACVDAFRECNATVYDLTIAYPGYSGEVPTYKMGYGREKDTAIPNGQGVLCGVGPNEVHINIERVPCSQVPADRVAFLDERWKRKEALLEEFIATGRFPSKDSHPRTVFQPRGSLGGVLIFLVLLAAEAWVVNAALRFYGTFSSSG